MTIEKMLNDIIFKFGYSSKYTINFAKLCETPNPDIEALTVIFNILMEQSIFLEN